MMSLRRRKTHNFHNIYSKYARFHIISIIFYLQISKESIINALISHIHRMVYYTYKQYVIVLCHQVIEFSEDGKINEHRTLN